MDQFSPLQRFSVVFFFSLAVSLLFISLSLKLLRTRPWCSCTICRDYTTGKWAEEFPNLCDWAAAQLRRSPTNTIHIHVLGNIITANPENVEHILKTRFENYPKGQPFSSILGDLLGRGIFNVDGELWRFQRKVAALELSAAAVRSFSLRIISSEVSSRLLPLLNSVSTVDLQDVFKRLSMDCICKISFGVDPACLELDRPMSEFVAAFDSATSLSAARALAVAPLAWKIKRILCIGSERELRKAVGMIDVLAREVIRRRRKLRNFAGGEDLLSRFMGYIHDEEFLRDIVVSFLLAGRDTVASALTAFFYLLSEHEEEEEAIMAEISRVLGDAAPSWEKLREMNYTRAAVYESLRLYPPVQFDSKFAAGGDVLPDGTAVEKGARVTYHAYAMGRMEKAWGKDCFEFRPRRWLGEDGRFKAESPFKYPVFHGGARLCIGKEMAEMEVMLVAVSVVREFRVRRVEPGAPLRFAPGLTATVRGGLPVQVLRRRGLERE